ncbi:MAG: family 20 glycosylhydrolase [Actinomycetaceae bacterium]|nr:family 20 glycosylhydrolase [Actinomycetaceae bacterium]
MLSQLPPSLIGPVEGRKPLHEWRGLMIDSARTCFSVSTIELFIDLAHRYGFNRLHWHLTDDAGWRFDVPDYPRLTEVAAYRPRSRFDNYTNEAGETIERAAQEAPSKWTAGYYTDSEIQHLIAYAADRGIEILPEVDIPGHMMAAIEAYPQFGRPNSAPLPKHSMRDDQRWPAQNDLLWPTDEALEFVLTAVDRIIDLFPGSTIHVGGDECAYDQWATDPDIDKWLKLRGLKSVPEIQTWFLDAVADRVRARGRRVAGWDEICQITDDPNILMFAWDEERGMNRIAQSINPYVYADARSLYLNRIDPDAPQQQKGMIPGISVADILSTPWPEAEDSRCIGVQACLWSEFILDEADLLDMAFPRLLAVSERMFNPQAADNVERVEAEYEVLTRALKTRQ